MSTNRATVTSSIETDASPETVLEILSDPRRIPTWASGFADRVEADLEGHWHVTKGGKVFPIDVVVFARAQTIDYLREAAPGKKVGVYIRVLSLARGGGVVVMTLPIVPGASTEETAAILNEELQELIKICSSR
jgi:hypothetical protein